MRLNVIKNAKQNIIAGWLTTIYYTVVPFFSRTILIYTMGLNYVGLSSLFNSILSVLNLAELGVSSAINVMLYEAVAKQDEQRINSLMALFRKYYRWIGLFVLMVGLVYYPFLPYFVKSGVPKELNLHILYLLQLANTVLSYWLFAYRNTLFYVHQKSHIPNLVSLTCQFVSTLFQLLVILLFHSYYGYMIIALFATTSTNVLTAFLSKKYYPQYSPKGMIEKEERKKIHHNMMWLISGKLAGVILNSSDTLVMSTFLGLTAMVLYQNYWFVLTAAINMVNVVLYSFAAGIGNQLVLDDKTKVYGHFRAFSILLMWIASFCGMGYLNLIQPFIQIWLGPSNQLSFGLCLCFTAYIFLIIPNMMLNMYKDVAGLWALDWLRPLLTSLLNLVLNLYLVNVWGYYGIVLSTIFAISMVGLPWLMRNIFKGIFGLENLYSYVKLFSILLISGILVQACVAWLCQMVWLSSPVLTVIGRGGIVFVVGNVGLWLCFRQLNDYDQMKEKVLRAIKR